MLGLMRVLNLCVQLHCISPMAEEGKRCMLLYCTFLLVELRFEASCYPEAKGLLDVMIAKNIRFVAEICLGEGLGSISIPILSQKERMQLGPALNPTIFLDW